VLFVKTEQPGETSPRGGGSRTRPPPNPRASEVDAEITRIGETNAEFMNGVPPAQARRYGHPRRHRPEPGHDQVAAVPFGDPPRRCANHPALKGRGRCRRPSASRALRACLTTASGLVIGGGGDPRAPRRLNAATGSDIWARPRCRGGSTARPMTYRCRAGGRQFVVVANRRRRGRVAGGPSRSTGNAHTGGRQ